MTRITTHRGTLAASVLTAAAMAAFIWAPAARAADGDVVLGQRHTLRSKVLGEERAFWVHVPPGYESGSRRYPVLYLTDAEPQFAHTATTADFLARNGRIPPLIVVGVGNTDRARDLTPTRAALSEPDGGSTDFPTSGGAERFLDFFEKELIPRVEKGWRTAPYRLFFGHSFGGLFAVHAFLARPALFDAVVAVSPTLGWDDDLELRRAREFFAGREALDKTLVVTLGSEGPRMQAGFDALKRLLESARPAGFEWAMEQFRDENHGSVVLRSHEFALRRIFTGWAPPLDPLTGQVAGGIPALVEHYRKLSKRFGTDVPPPEPIVNGLGYAALGRKDVDGALAYFELNLRHYPDSANVYDSLGEALEAAGRLDEARANYEKAVERGEKANDRSLEAFREHLGAIRKRLEAAKP